MGGLQSKVEEEEEEVSTGGDSDGFWLHEYEKDASKAIRLCMDISLNINFYIHAVRGKKIALQRLLRKVYSKMGMGPFLIEKYINFNSMELREVDIIKENHVDVCTLLSIMYQSGKSYSLISMLMSRMTNNGEDIPVNLLDIFFDRFKVKLKCSPMILQEMIRFNDKLSELMVAVKSVGIKKSKEVANFLMKNID